MQDSFSANSSMLSNIILKVCVYCRVLQVVSLIGSEKQKQKKNKCNLFQIPDIFNQLYFERVVRTTFAFLVSRPAAASLGFLNLHSADEKVSS